MTPGLPGAGIGGLFYLLAALFSPVWETVRLLRGNGAPRQWVVVLRLFALALSIVAAMWLTAWIVVAVFSLAPHADGGGTASSAAAMLTDHRSENGRVDSLHTRSRAVGGGIAPTALADDGPHTSTVFQHQYGAC